MEDFNVKAIDHIRFVVKDLESTIKKWETVFGIELSISENKDHHIRSASLTLGGTRFVFNEPTQAGCELDQYIQSYGEGLEHIAFVIDDIETAAERTKKAGLALRFDQHKSAHGYLTNFVEKMPVTDVEFMGPEK